MVCTPGVGNTIHAHSLLSNFLFKKPIEEDIVFLIIPGKITRDTGLTQKIE